MKPLLELALVSELKTWERYTEYHTQHLNS